MNWTKMFVMVSCLLAMLVIAEQIYSYVCLYDQPDDAAKSPRLDCPKNCGSLKNITYPFGIGPRCFLDPRYEIDCQQNHGPVLKNLSVVVLKISRPASSKSPGLIKVRQPISYSHLNCTSNQKNDAPVNLTASDSIFRYSLRENYFIAGGCDSLALIASADTPWAVAGCKSSCSRNRAIGFDQCSRGIGCCMTSISDKIGAYHVEFKSLGWEAVAAGDAECRYAFLVERKWWHKADLQSLPRDVPVVLEWEITNDDFNMGLSHCIATFRNVGLSVGGGILPALLCFLCVFINRRRRAKLKQKFFLRNGGLLLQQRLSSIEDSHMEKGKLFAFTELDKATDHFNENRILGQGGQGTVYKGILMDGTIIAVKKSKVVDAGQVEQFVNEVFILSEINHRNVVKLLGFCLESEVPLLVYEFIPNGTLYQYLHDPDGEFPISWETRLRIANEVAGALSYLHFAAAIPVYHRDIKSSNILLDGKYRAKVADFGASRSITIDQTHLTTMVRGTFRYLDPEYYQTSQFTDKSDVYSFGVVLVELLTGEKPISQIRAEEGKNLSTYFVISMEENRLFDVLDKEVLDHGDKEEIIAVSNLANRCLNPNGRHRPTMKEVSMELERIRSLRNPVVVRHSEEEIDRIKTGSICGAAYTLMQSEANVELTSWFYDLPR